MNRDRLSGQEVAIIPRNDQRIAAGFATIPVGPDNRNHDELGRVPIDQYLFALYRNRWGILAFCTLCIGAAIGISLRMTPLYESTAVIDIDRNGEVEAVGNESRPLGNPNSEQFMTTQIRLVESDAVLRPIAAKYNLPLDQNVSWLAPRHTDDDAARKGAPAALKNLKVTHPPQTFLIYIQYRAKDPALAATVANEIALSYIDHVFRIRSDSSKNLSRFMEQQLDELRAKMETSNSALAAYERQLNMIDPEERTSIMSARLLQLNTEFTAAQAERVRKEAAFRALGQGSIDAASISNQGTQLRELRRRHNEALESFAKVTQHYGPNHPSYSIARAELDQLERSIVQTNQTVQKQIRLEYDEAMQREEILRRELLGTKGEFDRLNASSFQYKNLKREADADRKLYEELVAKTKQATINSGFPSSAIRLADRARPAYSPVSPNIKLNTLLAGFFSLIFAFGAAILRDSMDNSVRDPELVAATVGAEVLGTLPRVRSANRLIPSMLAESSSTETALVRLSDAGNRSISSYQESVKTLNASIMLADFQQQVRSIMVTSASPAEGKSTVATTVAIANAAKGSRVLLVDGDLRRPSIADKLGITRTQGLSDLCLKNVSWRDAVHALPSLPNLDVLVAGQANRRAIDRLGLVVGDLLAEAIDEYDYVVLDCPPLLGFPEPLHLATLVDGVLLVAMAGSTNRKALKTCATQLQRVGGNVLGIVVNGATRENHSGAYYHHYYSPGVASKNQPVNRQSTMSDLTDEGEETINRSIAS